MNRNAFAPRKRLRSLSITGTAVTTVLLLISSAQAQAPDLAPRPGTAGASFPHPFAVQSPSQEGTIVGPLYYPPAHQDISGVWWTQSYSSKMPIVGGGDLPFSEMGSAKYAENLVGLSDGSVVDEARRFCTPDGIPRILGNPYPFQIIQVPGLVTLVYELNHYLRHIPLDLPVLPDDELELFPFYSGHSVGHWEGDTLVIETAGFNEVTFIDATGAPHSDQLTTLERVRRLDDGTLETIVTVTDPVMYTEPWSARFVYDLHPEVELEEYHCGEPHRDISHVPGVAEARGRTPPPWARQP